MQNRDDKSKVWPVIVVGGGPCGIAAAAELKRKNIESLILEKGSVTESIRRYPLRMHFFSTAENIEIAKIPFPTSNVKASRSEALQYYRKVAQYYNLNFALNTTATSIHKNQNTFFIHTSKGYIFRARFVVIATGYFDRARQLGIVGENLPSVNHYYQEPFAHSFQSVVIVGGGNSAIEAALELYRHNVKVTMVVRGKELKPTAKYWLVPDIKNRIKEGKITVIYTAQATEIREGEIDICIDNGERRTLAADHIYLLIGYLPDATFLEQSGLKPQKESLLVSHNPSSYETEVKGLYLCGTVLAGVKTEKVFIENGRQHAQIIAEHIARACTKTLSENNTISPEI